jgi:DNA polymerase-3 subunit beta
MELKVDKQALLNELHKVSKVSPTRSTMPILNSILFEVSDNQLILRSSDIEITMSSVLEIDGIEDGNVAMPTRMVLDIIGAADEGLVVLKASEEGKVEVQLENGVFEIPGRPGEEFPSVPTVKKINAIEINNKILKKLIQKTIIAVSKDELKPALMGVLLQIKPDEIRSVATDGHRLVCQIRKDFKSEDFQGEVIIPTKFLNLLLNYLEEEGSTALTIGENHVKVEIENTTIYSRVIDERFPDYKSVIPQDNDKVVKIGVSGLLSTLRRVSIFSNKTTKQVSFTLDKNLSRVSTVDQETGSAGKESIEIDYSGEKLVVGFNADYLRDILRNVDTESAVMKFKTAITACLIAPESQEENEELVMLLMPIRLSESEY